MLSFFPSFLFLPDLPIPLDRPSLSIPALHGMFRIDERLFQIGTAPFSFPFSSQEPGSVMADECPGGLPCADCFAEMLCLSAPLQSLVILLHFQAPPGLLDIQIDEEAFVSPVFWFLCY